MADDSVQDKVAVTQAKSALALMEAYNKCVRTKRYLHHHGGGATLVSGPEQSTLNSVITEHFSHCLSTLSTSPTTRVAISSKRNAASLQTTMDSAYGFSGTKGRSR